MDGFLWVLQWGLAGVYFMAGAMKLMLSYDNLVANPRTGWAEAFAQRTVKLIGLAEVAGAIGLVLPPLIDIASFLSPLAASGLVVLMLGAVAIHYRRGEIPMVGLNLVLGALAATIAIWRFGPELF